MAQRGRYISSCNSWTQRPASHASHLLCCPQARQLSADPVGESLLHLQRATPRFADALGACTTALLHARRRTSNTSFVVDSSMCSSSHSTRCGMLATSHRLELRPPEVGNTCNAAPALRSVAWLRFSLDWHWPHNTQTQSRTRSKAGARACARHWGASCKRSLTWRHFSSGGRSLRRMWSTSATIEKGTLAVTVLTEWIASTSTIMHVGRTCCPRTRWRAGCTEVTWPRAHSSVGSTFQVQSKCRVQCTPLSIQRVATYGTNVYGIQVFGSWCQHCASICWRTPKVCAALWTERCDAL